jgi:tRNA dimethylallyltransferase
MDKKIHIICGATCSGKTAFAVDYAKNLLAQKNHSGNNTINNAFYNLAAIINCDSMQIYKELPILTAQPKPHEMSGLPHLLYGFESILEHSSVAKWLQIAVPLVQQKLDEGIVPILVGGTGMYINSLKNGINSVPETAPEIKNYVHNFVLQNGVAEAYKLLQEKAPDHAANLKPADTQRIERGLCVALQTGKSLLWWNAQPAKKFFTDDIRFEVKLLSPPREQIYAKINARFLNMIDEGVLDEVLAMKPLYDNGKLHKLNPSFKAHGLRELLAYLDGKMSLEDAISHAQQITRNYAKRQTTWFKGQLSAKGC